MAQDEDTAPAGVAGQVSPGIWQNMESVYTAFQQTGSVEIEKMESEFKRLLPTAGFEPDVMRQLVSL